MDDHPLKVLHVIGGAGGGDDSGLPGLLRDLQEASGPTTHDVVVVGSSRDARRVREAGVRMPGHAPSSDRITADGAAVLRRVIFAPQGDEKPYDLLHGWSPAIFDLTAHAGGRLPCLATCGGPATRPQELQTLQLRRPKTQVMSWTGVQRDHLVEIGFDPSCVHVVRPGVKVNEAAADQRETLRSSWSVDPEILVVGVPTRQGARIDARQMAAIMSRLHAAEKDVRFVVSSEVDHLEGAMRILRPLHLLDHLIVDDAMASPSVVAPGLDVACTPCDTGPHTPEDLPGLAVLQFSALGVPVLDSANAALVSDEETAMLHIKPGDDIGICDGLGRLHDDPDLPGRLGESVRTQMETLCPWDDFQAALESVYRRMVEQN